MLPAQKIHSSSAFPLSQGDVVAKKPPLKPTSLQTKLQILWEKFISFFSCLRGCPTSLVGRIRTTGPEMKPPSCHVLRNPDELIQMHVDNIADKEKTFQQIKLELIGTNETAFKQQETNQRLLTDWLESHQQAFLAFKKITSTEKLNPCQLPKKIAFQLSEILIRYGLALYGSDQPAHPFQSSLDVLKAALLVQQYALGISLECPNFTDLSNLGELYSKDEVRGKYITQADISIDNLQPDLWTQKVGELNEAQLFYIPKLLRYIHGAMRYLKIEDANKSEHLLDTAKACLLEAQKNPKFNKVEVDNQLAELIYNDITGLVADKLTRHLERQEFREADLIRLTLADLWEDCVVLSKDPEKMRARCNTKRSFIEHLPPQEELRLRQEALNGHLALPPERQDSFLLCIAWNNLSVAQEQLVQIPEALKSIAKAHALAIECRSKGIDNVQLNDVFKNAHRWADSKNKENL